ncbi:MAG: hypothetical protein GXP14_07475 [Gammaproteobacteria bacterium]|nr:hypothetical protein [Gammaproteobacteria bacterium]
MNELVAHGKNAGDVLEDMLKKQNAHKINQADDLTTGSLLMVLYCEDWPIVKLGAKLEKIVLPLGKPKETSAKIAYNH